MAWIVELLLPVGDPAGRAYSSDAFAALQRELTDRFGGVTAYTRAPARGRWDGGEGQEEEDDVVLFEVMTPELDRAWWAALRRRLERDLGQDEILMRAHEVERL